MNSYSEQINALWQEKDVLVHDNRKCNYAKSLLAEIINALNDGIIRVVEYKNDTWITNIWIKYALLLYFKIHNTSYGRCGIFNWYDKIDLKFANFKDEDFDKYKIRAVPGCIVRTGVYIGPNTVIMPCFINFGAYIGANTMIDTYASVGTCAQIGANCHISSGVIIGGVLEPVQNTPVVIENNCFIGESSGITEGVIVEYGAVIGSGVHISASTKIIKCSTGEITYGRVPSNSVVIAGTTPYHNNTNIACALIVKEVNEHTRNKTEINRILRK